ncbi:MAG: hypothetical protein ACOC5F_06365 [Candidatus Aminicenantaceae bacterium]
MNNSSLGELRKRKVLDLQGNPNISRNAILEKETGDSISTKLNQTGTSNHTRQKEDHTHKERQIKAGFF